MLLFTYTLMTVANVIQEEKLALSWRKWENQCVSMSELWNRLLEKFHKTSKDLHDPRNDLGASAKLYTTHYHFVNETRDSNDETELKAKANSPHVHKYVDSGKTVENMQ
jgi:hypothetical protein